MDSYTQGSFDADHNLPYLPICKNPIKYTLGFIRIKIGYKTQKDSLFDLSQVGQNLRVKPSRLEK